MGRRWDANEAAVVAEELLEELDDTCTRSAVAGDLRRQRKSVAQLDLVLLVPQRNKLDDVLDDLVFQERLHRRTGAATSTERLVHLGTGLPVVLHVAPELARWPHVLVTATGPDRFVRRLHRTARRRRWQWYPELGGVLKRQPEGKEHVLPPQKMLQRYTSEIGLVRSLAGRWVRPEART